MNLKCTSNTIKDSGVEIGGGMRKIVCTNVETRERKPKGGGHRESVSL